MTVISDVAIYFIFFPFKLGILFIYFLNFILFLNFT